LPKRFHPSYVAHGISSSFQASILLGESLDWSFLATCSPLQFARWLRQAALRVDLRALKKRSRGPKKPKRKLPCDPKRPHESTHQPLIWKKKIANSDG
jgi:hypothetical protein